MRTYKSLWFLIALSSCAPMRPMQQNGIYPVARIDSRQATIHMEHLGNLYHHYVFDLEVINHSADTIEIMSQDICYYSSSKLVDLPSFYPGDQYTATQPAATVSRALFARSTAEMKRIVRDKLRAKAGAEVFLTLLSVGLAVHDNVQDGKDYNKETWTKKDAQRFAGRDAAVASAVIAAGTVQDSHLRVAEEFYYLPYEIFPHCKVPPGARHRGKIYLPIESGYRYTRIFVPVNEEDFVFHFRRR